MDHSVRFLNFPIHSGPLQIPLRWIASNVKESTYLNSHVVLLTYYLDTTWVLPIYHLGTSQIQIVFDGFKGLS